MNTRILRGAPAIAAACCTALLAIAPQPGLAADGVDRAALEKQLAEARTELDKAAREIAEISRQLYDGASEEAMHFVHGGARGSMLGVNIGGGVPRDDGVEVVGVSPGGPAEQAGIRAGDVLVAVDGKALQRSGDRGAGQQLVELMRAVEPGRDLKVDYLRDGKKRTASVTTAPAEPPIVRMFRERMLGPMDDASRPLMPDLANLLGPERAFRSLELVPLTPRLGAYFGTDKGLLVVRVAEGKDLPLEEGDVLQTIDGRTPESPGHAFRILRSYQPGEKVKLGVLRQRKLLVLDATITSPSPAQRRVEQRILTVPAAPPPPPPRPAPARPGDGPA